MADLALATLLRRGVSEWNQQRPLGSALDLTHLEIKDADFRGIDLRGADFDGSTFRNVDFGQADLRHARLNGVQASRTSFEAADLRDVELKGTDLKQVCLRRANLDGLVAFELKIRHATLEHASLRGARMRFAHLYNCDLRGARLHGAQLEHAVFKRVVSDASAGLTRAGIVLELENQPNPAQWVDWTVFDINAGGAAFGVIVHQGQAYWISAGRWDFFISHASVDKETVARPLAEALKVRGMRVWFDETEVKVGDDLSDVITFGTKASLFGVVVLSKDFFGRRWTEAELRALLDKRVFFVLHGITAPELAQLRPEIRDKVSLNATDGANRIADALVQAVRAPPREL